MIFINTIYAALLAASAVTAAPSTLTPRQGPGSILLCQNTNYGQCQRVPIVINECVNVPAGFTNNVSALDTSGYTCVFYDDGNCPANPGPNKSARFKGQAVDLKLYNSIRFLDNKISSVKCT
ncbi:hypothetical protein LZ554_003474 [Drepanopeziza brunnea f. sp. 'monogermtubi']|nr:hypothetical protein LZ554_003474 [Drepanopeziza brunnea f. sp. 'monogermtubi']